MAIKDLKDKADRLLAPHLDAVTVKVNKIIDSTGVKARDLWQDEQTMLRVFKTAYDSLPFVLRMAVKENVFVDFCKRHRERFTGSSDDDSLSDAREEPRDD
jgi:hypothetical protein